MAYEPSPDNGLTGHPSDADMSVIPPELRGKPQYRSVKGSGCVDGWFRWLRPGGVVSPFDVPFHVL
ncbi:hypothetical protein, partial [Gordonia jinhuaensis]|uniref:hypothetical protein n=1 Tax=Gordonia jinhuaensis TaxID=1517702 RepID=UPI001E492B01